MIKKIILFSLVISQFVTSCSGSDDVSDNETQLINKENLLKKEFPVCTTLEKTENRGETSKGHAVFKNNNNWVTGQTIRIRFVGGSVELQNKIKEYASEWTSAANLNFVYVGTNDESDAAIFFQTGSNYTFGKSINFGQLSNPNATDEIIRGITLHEFGHLLGLQHENQSPAANIQWNKPVVYDYYQNVIGWNRDLVDSQIFNALPTTSYNTYTPYDDSSVMTYSFPASFTLRAPCQKRRSFSHGSRSRVVCETTANVFPVSCCSAARASARAEPATRPLIEIMRAFARSSSRSCRYSRVSEICCRVCCNVVDC